MAATKKIFSIRDHQGNVIKNVGAPVESTDVATQGSAQTQADLAQAAAESTALGYANAAQAAAEATASLDATTKAGDAEQNAKDYADTLVLNANAAVLQDAKDYTDAEITALVGGADGAYDTLKELQDALNNNEDAVTALVNSVAQVSSDLDDEVTNRTNADNALGTEIDLLDTRLIAAEGSITTLTSGKADVFSGTITGSPSPTTEGYEYSLTHNLNKANVLVQAFEGNDQVDVFVRKVNNNSLKVITGSALGATILTIVVVG